MGATALTFWIVDDDLSFGRSLKRLLGAQGYDAEYFGSARSFLDSVPPGQAGYAIIDIHMPDCTGFELMKKMRELRYRMPMILITGHAPGGWRELALENGAVGFLQKPFSQESLMELVAKHEAN